jgi:putative phage-type endonuclease
MNYEILNVTQGSDEWLQIRKECDTASEAPSALGVGKYKTRDELLLEKKTGIVKEVDAATQALFNRGHETEAQARLIAEKIIGAELYPITARLGIDGLTLLASMDGLTMSGDIGFEHKLLSEELKQQVLAKKLDPHYSVQLDQEMLVTGADKIMFATSDGTEENFFYFWYETTDDNKADVINGWKQFNSDLAAFVPPLNVDTLEAEAVESLPVPSVVVKGEITQSNLGDITPKFDAYLKSIKTELSTDQDFADAEANAKNCRETAKRIEAIQENIIAQMVSVNEVNSVLSGYKAQFNNVGLKLEKAVKEQKENLKTIAVMAAQQAFTAHVQLLEAETKPIRLNVAMPDFGGAIKGIKTVASMHSRINDALAAGKMNADAVARDLRAKQQWLKENADGYQFLFADINTIIHKPMDDLQTLAKLRISDHKEAEAAKAKAMQEQAEAAARAKIEQEQREAEAAKATPVTIAEVDQPVAKPIEAVSPKRVSKIDEQTNIRMTIVGLVASHYGISDDDAHDKIIDCFGLAKAA